MRFIAVCVALVGAACAHAQAPSQPWPTKPVRIIVPAAPGGGTDTIGRFLGAHFSAALGQQFVIDNRAGAAGLIGYQIAARTAGDGYTLVVAPTAIATLPIVIKNPQYDPVKDFAPISQVVASAQALVVPPSLPAKSLADFVAVARKRANELSFASPGEGSVPHLAMQHLQMLGGMQLTHVPYKGVAPALADVIGGRVSALLVNVISAKPHIEAGKLRALAVSSRKRAEALPSVPTIDESGYPGYEALQWFGLFTTAGTPPRIVSRLHALTVAALKDPDTKKRLADEEPIGNTPEEFSRAIKLEVEKWKTVAKASNIQPH